ncbi:unnamed protein product [Owenia fusiformis]|uniref:Peptidase S8/S53 domain-containing protein n=1 Tax=Owenia fusiformis TaxID=6347 RepID=A0A8S4NVH9_OWEFU|nr:unnamed protein product [Owenia fusiformis]
MAASWGADSLDGFTDTRAKCDGISCSWLSGSVNIKGTGEGVHVYIFDTGVDLKHPEFCGRIQTVYDASGGSGQDLSVDGHGTHVAGIIAGATTGVAPDATIHILQLENEYGAMTLQTILCAIEMAKNDIEKNNRTRVIGSMSIQGGHNKVLNDALAELAKMPVPLPIVVAAGNYLEGYSLTRDSCECSPASEETVITVAGSDGAYVCDTSNTGSCVDIFAPGIGINTTSRGSTYDSQCEGTSYAAPFVTGALAAYISTLPESDLPLTTDDLKLLLDKWWGKDRPGLYSPLSTFQGAPNRVLVYNQCP